MAGPRLITALVTAVLLMGAGAARVGAEGSTPGLPWNELLPAQPSPTRPQPRPVANCPQPGPRCVEVAARRLRRLQNRLGCDHRAVFATTYLQLTLELRDTVRGDPHFFRFPRYFFVEDALFANIYVNTVRRWHHGRPVPPAWRIAFETAQEGEVSGAQDMLLGINAHVQNDMPLVLARLGLRTPAGVSRKADHDKANEVLDSGYERVVAAVRRRYDPDTEYSNSPLTPIDNIGGLELVREWRERVWRNAERLANADSRAEWRSVRSDIQEYAAEWARGIAAMQTPGTREQRDDYCRAQLGET